MEAHKKINSDQLKFLNEFCKKKDIEFIELRWEFVDHLAEMIEKKWVEKPHLDFKDAFHEVYKTFGIFGFSEIAEQHKSIAQKNYWNSIKLEFLKMIKFPHVFVIILLYTLVYSTLNEFPVLSKFFWIFMYISLISVFIYFTVQTKKLNQRLNQNKSMYLQITQQFFWVLYLFMISPNINILFDSQEFIGVTKEPPILLTTTVFTIITFFTWFNYKLMVWSKIQVGKLIARRFD